MVTFKKSVLLALCILLTSHCVNAMEGDGKPAGSNDSKSQGSLNKPCVKAIELKRGRSNDSKSPGSPKKPRLSKRPFSQAIYSAFQNPYPNTGELEELLGDGASLDIVYRGEPLVHHAINWLIFSLNPFPLLYLLENGGNFNRLNVKSGETTFSVIIRTASASANSANAQTIARFQREISPLSDSFSLLSHVFSEEFNLTPRARLILAADEILNRLLEIGVFPQIDDHSYCLGDLRYMPSGIELLKKFLFEGGIFEIDLENSPDLIGRLFAHPLLRNILLNKQDQAEKLIKELSEEEEEGIPQEKLLLFQEAFLLASGQGRADSAAELLKFCSSNQEVLQHALRAAAGRGHLEIFNLILPWLNEQDSSTATYVRQAFARAAGQGHHEIIRVIAENATLSAMLESTDISRSFIIAAQNGHIDILNALLRLSAGLLEPAEQIDMLQRALERAAINYQEEAVVFILSSDQNFSISVAQTGTRLKKALQMKCLTAEIALRYKRICEQLRLHTRARINLIALDFSRETGRMLGDTIPAEVNAHILSFIHQRVPRLPDFGSSADWVPRIFE